MTRPVRPRALVHHGHHQAVGLFFANPDEARLRAAALAAWTPGTRVFAVDGGLWVRFPTPRPLDADRAPGHLVVREGGADLAVPLTVREREALAPAPGTLVLARGGEALAIAPSAELDPARWLELVPQVVPLVSLGAPPPPPAEAPPVRDVRAVLSAPAPAPELAQVVAALARADQASAALGGLGPARARGSGLLARLAPLLARLARRPTPAAPSSTGTGSTPAHPRGPGFLRRLLDRLALLSGVAHLVGAQQAAYLRRMLEMFDSGDLEEALRHAIPLGRDGDASHGLSLGPLGPRGQLSIRPGQAPVSSALVGGPDLHAHLRQLYRSTFERLHAAGRFQEAAFVLAELLKENEEAVSYLERQGELRLAAELAEGRGLAPGLVIRHWFLARDVGRALAVARRTGAYADAVTRLERTGRGAEAAAFRLIWAEDLAVAGDLEGAVTVVKDVPSARALRLGWMQRAIAAGGVAGHALLFAWLAALPDRFDEARVRVREACERPAPEGPLLRAALVRGLLAEAGTEATAALARPLLRAVLGDRHRRDPALTGVDLKRLVALAADGALDQDLPPEPMSAPGQPPELRFSAAPADRGTRRALDAAALPGGRLLVAHGEAGAVLLGRDGHQVAALDAPAHRLVVSDLGTRALALAPRGKATRVSWLDLEARTVRHLGDLELGAWASSFDGAAWAVAVGPDVRLLDVLGGLRTLWRVPEAGYAPGSITGRSGTLGFVTGGMDGDAVGWRYEGAQLVLRGRGPVMGQGPFALGPEGRWMTLHATEAGEVLVGEASTRPDRLPIDLGAGEPLALEGDGLILAAAVRGEAGVRILAHDGGGRMLATLELGGARAVSLRVQGARLTAADDVGRVVGADLAAGRVTHDVRC